MGSWSLGPQSWKEPTLNHRMGHQGFPGSREAPVGLPVGPLCPPVGLLHTLLQGRLLRFGFDKLSHLGMGGRVNQELGHLASAREV